MSEPAPSREDQERRRTLPRLIPIPAAIAGDLGIAGRRRLIAWLAVRLAAERRRGLARHWTYDLARHSALMGVFRGEVAALARLEGLDRLDEDGSAAD